MNKQILTLLLGTLLLFQPSRARAQADSDDAMLEKRVSEEVAEEGLSLARLGLRIVILQTKGGGARIEIVETATKHAVMTRSIKQLSKEREAMIAELTMIASALVREHTAGSGQMLGLLATGGTDVSDALQSKWSIAMSPTEILARHRPTSIHLVVLPSGNLDSEANAAAEALANAYRVGGVAKVQGPSTAASLDTAAVLKRFASSSADERALLSVLLVEGQLRAVVTIYDRRGEVITAMSMIAGVPLSPSEGDGVYLNSQDTIGTIKGERSAALNEYRRESIAMGSVMVAGVGYLGNVRYARKGVMGGPLSGVAFYRAVDRQDYAARYQDVRDKKRRGKYIGTGGVLGLAGFGIWALVAAGINSAPTEDADWQTPALLTVLSAGVAIGGIWYAAAQGNPDPVNEQGRIELAKTYNAKLRTRLGLTEEETGSLEETAERYNLQLSPYVNGSGGGIGVGGSF